MEFKNSQIHPKQRLSPFTRTTRWAAPENENIERVTNASISIKTFGTEAQRKASLIRLKQELELQGFDVEITVLSWT